MQMAEDELKMKLPPAVEVVDEESDHSLENLSQRDSQRYVSRLSSRPEKIEMIERNDVKQTPQENNML